MKKIILLFCAFFPTIAAFAQLPAVTGRLLDAGDKSPLIGAGVVLLNPGDSSMYKGTVADLDGKFTITDLAQGKYILKISFLGYTDYKKAITVGETPLVLGDIAMQQPGTTLKGVEIQEKLPTAVQKGDTTQFNANAFKTNPDASAEDLVGKMPGVTVQDGKVQAQGEDVKQILVDGKPFFGDDPNAVLKNLPADVIDKIQVFDKQSDQSQLTGFNDGNTSKTINIITKPNMRNGIFGKVYAGYGYEDVYKAGGNINFFKDKRRISIIAQSNNINEQNFSAEDLAGVSSSSGGGGARGGGGRSGGGGAGRSGGSGGSGGNANDFQVSNKNGISTTHALGLNYTDKWANKVDVTASYFFNWSDNVAIQKLNRRYALGTQTGRTYGEDSRSDATNVNHRFNARIDWKLDSMNSILITPKLSVQFNNGSSNLFGNNMLAGIIFNSTTSDFGSNLGALNFNNDILYRHKFKKQGRTITFDLNTGLNGTDANNSLYARNDYFDPDSTSLVDQQSTLDKKGIVGGISVNYTEPLSKKSILQFSYTNSFTSNESDKRTFNYSSNSGRYDQMDTVLSNLFENNYSLHRGGLGYRLNTTKMQLVLNASYQYAELRNDRTFPMNYKVEKYFSNILPSLVYRYNFTTKKNLRIIYRTQTQQPTADQLQDVVNNSNPLQLSSGNSQLKQEYQHSAFVRYSSTNTDKASSFFFLVGGAYSENYITNSTFVAANDTVLNGIALAKGVQLTQPTNLNNYYNVRTFVTYGVPISKLKTNLNLNFGVNYTQTPGMINGALNYAKSPNGTLGVTLSSNISQSIDFTLSSNSGYTYVNNTVNTSSNNEYFSQTSRARLNVLLKQRFVFNTDLNHQFYRGLSAGYNQNYILWNASVAYKFLKSRLAEVRFTVFDILHQNTNVSRNITDVYTEDVQTNALQRYYMLTLTYNFKKFGTGNKAPAASPQ